MIPILILIALAWPLVAAGAAGLIGWGSARLLGRRAARDAPTRARRSGWLLSTGAALAAVASYGFGVGRTTSLLMTDAEDRCAIAARRVSPGAYHASSDGVQSLWPLHDTTCGPDLVPALVNPLVVTSTVLSLAFAAATIASYAGAARKPRTA